MREKLAVLRAEYDLTDANGSDKSNSTEAPSTDD